MKDNQAMQLSSNQYYQGCGVLSHIGSQVIKYGNNVMIISDSTVFPKVSNKILQSFQKYDITYHYYDFKGYCSPSNYDTATLSGKKNQVNIIIGEYPRKLL